MRLLLVGYIVVLAILPAGCGLARMPKQRFEYRQLHMGVQTRIALYAADEASAIEAARHAFARIAVLDSIMSDYRQDSELMRLSAASGGPPVRVSEPLFEVLSMAQELARLSDGAFDVTAGPLVRLWRTARRSGELPEEQERRRAAARVGWRKLELDPAARTARLTVPGMQLDLGGIAKGYAADEAIRTLRRQGVASALVEMGGDVVVSAPPPGRADWFVAVPGAPLELRDLRLSHAAVSTSGDTEQFVEIDGVRYSHVVDPRTGIGLRSRVAATVVATDGALADALSTLLTVLGPEQGEAFARLHFPRATVYIRQQHSVTP